MREVKGRNGLLPNSLRIISSCLKTVSSNAGSVASAVRSAGTSVAASISLPAEDVRDQVLWVGFDKLEVGPASFKHVLMLGYSNGFQVLDVEDASNVCELVSKRDGPVTFLQMLPIPANSEGSEGFMASHPLLAVVAGDEANGSSVVKGGHLTTFRKENTREPQTGTCISTPTVVRFYSLKSHSYVHVLRFRSAVYIVRCSPRIVAVALAAQIYCFDAVTLENKFSVLTYPFQGVAGVNIGYGPMAVGPRWLAYPSNNPLMSNTGRLSPQNLTPSPGVSPSTSPSNGSLVARYAMESSKQLATGILNLGDMGYKTFSKYCHELLPDGSNSPLTLNSGRRIGSLPSSVHPSDVDNAGMVVIKDFISKNVISQFRAHTSPISALSFDPSGTLLVTASVQGHSLNVFRIMPVRVPNGSSSVQYDWTTSHVHLYKLYRGLTAAVIQDICFSNYSQWIAIVSSRGTCHIYVLSPFGGDTGLQAQNPHNDVPILVPNFPSPWWSSSSCMTNQQFLQPPPPVTLSVVSRIKTGNSGWLNTVNNVAASASGKTAVPSGAVAAVFHSSKYLDTLPVQIKANSLEHLLVYAPSGHVIQHELMPSSSVESSNNSSRSGSGLVQHQDEELLVNAETIQWWDVCRRSNWPEREESMSGIVQGNEKNAHTVMDTSGCEDNNSKLMSSANGTAVKEFAKSHERHNWFLSNAEVQISSGSIQIWQTSKICFYMINPSISGEDSVNVCAGGEIEIEKLPVTEVELRRKDLLPVFEQIHSAQTGWRESGLFVGTKHASSLKFNHGRDNSIKDSFTRHSKPASHSFESNIGPYKTVSLLSMESSPGELGVESLGSTPSLIPRKCSKKDSASFNFEHSNVDSLMDGRLANGTPSSGSSCAGMTVTGDTHSSSNGLDSEASNAFITGIHSDEQVEADVSRDSLEFTQYFHEDYCKVPELGDCCDSNEVVTDADSSSSRCGREKPDEDGDHDDMLGCVFAFSEEG